MKILQLCKKMPIPSKDGEAVAVLALAHAYRNAGHEVDLLCFNTSRHFVDKSEWQGLTHPWGNIDELFLNSSISYTGAALNLLKKTSYNIDRFDVAEMHTKLKSLLRKSEYDIIQYESLYMAPYLSTARQYSQASHVMRSHNLEFRIWEDMSNNTGKAGLGWYYGLCAKRLKIYEKSMLNAFDCHLSISDTDLKAYQSMGLRIPATTIPVGIRIEHYPVHSKATVGNIRLGYLGSLDWKPNIEGISWFFDKVWPGVVEQNPDASFHLAGRNPDPHIQNIKAEGLHFHGEVESAIEFMNGIDLVVVPLKSGSGIRVKILESMAMGKVVLSSQKGFEGIPVECGIHAECAKEAESYIQIINGYLSGRKKLKSIGHSARQFIKNRFDPDTLGKEAIQFILTSKNKIHGQKISRTGSAE